MRANPPLFQKRLQAFEVERFAPHRFEHLEVLHVLKPLRSIISLYSSIARMTAEGLPPRKTISGAFLLAFPLIALLQSFGRFYARRASKSTHL